MGHSLAGEQKSHIHKHLVNITTRAMREITLHDFNDVQKAFHDPTKHLQLLKDIIEKSNECRKAFKKKH